MGKCFAFIGLKFLLGNNLQLSIKAAGHGKGIKMIFSILLLVSNTV